MSLLYKVQLSTVVNAALAISGKTDPPPALRTLEELQEDEDMRRNSIEYAMLMEHETIFIRFSSKVNAKFHPRRPGEHNDDDDDSGHGGLSSSDQQSLLHGFGASSAGSFSSFTSMSSAVFNKELEAQMQMLQDEGEEIDEIDVRIAQMQHQRERQGKRRLRAQKQEKRSWNALSKTAPFDDLKHVERESRLDIEDIQEEFLEPLRDAWFGHECTGMAMLWCEEQKARAVVVLEEQDDNADNVVKACRALDDMLEEQELENVCKREEESRARSIATAAASSSSRRRLSDVAIRPSAAPAPAIMFHVSPAAATAACASPSPSAASSDYEHRLASSAALLSGVPPQPREPMAVPVFTRVNAPKKPPPPPPPPSDEEILLKMKVRKERYTREKMEAEEQLDRGVIVAHFKEEMLSSSAAAGGGGGGGGGQGKSFAPGSLEERITNAHRVDLRPPR